MKINAFVTTKMGEVVAFGRIGADTLKKGERGFRKMLNQQAIDKMTKRCTDLEERILIIARANGVEAGVEKEAKETQKKVLKMRDTYVDGKWSDDSELLEWMGFYTGASLVHWELIAGAARAMKLPALISTSADAIAFYSTFLFLDEKKLKKMGAATV